MTHLLSADDAFHPASDDPWWTETVWFSWIVPDRGLIGYFYPVFRPNVGVQFGGVVLFGQDGVPPWEEPVHAFDWHQPMQTDLDLRDLRLDSGLALRVIEPGRTYQLAYDGRDLVLDLNARAVSPALVTRSSTPPLGAGHVDQMCRVTGSMVLHGERIDVDCLAIRDRAWGPRPDGRQPRVSYSWGAASDKDHFLAACVHRNGIDVVTTGFLVRDGHWSRITTGERTTTRAANGQVETVRVTAEDEDGRRVDVQGSALGRHLFQGYPSMICWSGLVRWDLDGLDAWGEDQDVWSPRGWRRHRSTTPSATTAPALGGPEAGPLDRFRSSAVADVAQASTPKESTS